MKTNQNARKWALLAILATLAAGCQYRSYREGNARYTSVSVGMNQAVAPFTMEAGKKDDPSYRKLDSKGVTNDATSAIEAAVSAAVRAAKP